MRKRYDFTQGLPNPYPRQLKRKITLSIDLPTITYFKGLAEKTEIPYQTLLTLYLRECAATHKHLRLAWDTPGGSKSA